MAARTSVERAAFVVAPIIAALVYAILPDQYLADGKLVLFTSAGKASAAIAVLMAIWWLTEAVHISVTALLPLILLPLLGATKLDAAAAPYANPLIFLFLGGFILSIGMERWELHRRIALGTLRLVGNRPANIVGGIMLATAFISMWVSNTATAVVMLPIALSVIQTSSSSDDAPDQRRRFALCLLLGVAYASSIGGLGTLIGTPPNLFLASYVKANLGREISFVRWMLLLGIPLVVVLLPLTWLLLTRFLFPLTNVAVEGGPELARRSYEELGPMRRGEKIVLFVFTSCVAAWLTSPYLSKLELGSLRPFSGLSDPVIAMLGGTLLFLLPVERINGTTTYAMDWRAMDKVPWGILLLFGGGLSLAEAIEKNGVGQLLGAAFSGLDALHPALIALAVITVIVFLTELTSNTATTATMVPILAGVARGLDMDPYLLIVPAAISASCAFMLPAATPPNAIVFGSGQIALKEMARAGFYLNLVSIAVIFAFTQLLVSLL
jgi:sodium-dependent dicarboxylate transporter 2/3/5